MTLGRALGSVTFSQPRVEVKGRVTFGMYEKGSRKTIGTRRRREPFSLFHLARFLEALFGPMT